MGKLKISGKDLREIGYPQGPVIAAAISAATENFPTYTKNQVLKILEHVLLHPINYADDKTFGKDVQFLIPKQKDESEVYLNNTGVNVNIFGQEFIEQGAIDQINMAARLPISFSAALMPDAHQGYGLPIGGVLATENAVIPYGVGVDIGCRMCLSIFDIDPKELMQRNAYFAKELGEATLFGSGAQFKRSPDHEVMDRKLFWELPLLTGLHARAWKQLGTSGSGNHFAEFGIVEIDEADEVLKVPAGKYVGLLSHSGSRALGANIANYYTKLAISKRRLPQDAKNLAWLSLDEEEGMEYWLAMNLAGDYASACHHVIHAKIAKQLGRKPVKMVENHHNFAWKEMYEGKEVIVHRKGATPAGKNVLGIIPGSMTASGFIVKGKGVEASVNSASHGAGRKMSRTAAINSITHHTLNEMLARHGVKLMGGGLDE